MVSTETVVSIPANPPLRSNFIFIILEFIKNKSKEIRIKKQLYLTSLHHVVRMAQSVLSAVFVYVLLQMVMMSQYDVVMLTIATGISYILFAIAFRLVARSLEKSIIVRSYMIISAYGLVLLFTSNQAIILLGVTYPPF